MQYRPAAATKGVPDRYLTVNLSPTTPFPAGASAAGLRKTTTKLRLLIVEDELMLAWDLGEIAQTLGHSVCAAVPTQEAAIDATLQYRPDIVLMDYRLAEGDGLAAARRIREDLSIPIIFCTAYGAMLEAEISSLRRAQVVDKPVSIVALRDALLRATSS